MLMEVDPTALAVDSSYPMFNDCRFLKLTVIAFFYQFDNAVAVKAVDFVSHGGNQLEPVISPIRENFNYRHAVKATCMLLAVHEQEFVGI